MQLWCLEHVGGGLASIAAGLSLSVAVSSPLLAASPSHVAARGAVAQLVDRRREAVDDDVAGCGLVGRQRVRAVVVVVRVFGVLARRSAGREVHAWKSRKRR